MRVLVTGASGFIGSRLVPRLSAEGHAVRAFGRDVDRMRAALAPGGDGREGGAELLAGDAISGAGLDQALEGVSVAYYLIHSMERPRAQTTATPFPVRERIAAENFAAAAARAKVERIVYLGGLVPRWHAGDDGPGPAASRHLASREEVERILLGAVPGSLALRASIVIGARSRSFRLLVRLVERMPVLALPSWQRYRTKPIDERDVIEMLAASARVRSVEGHLEVGGPDVLSYGEMLRRIAELMMVRRPAIRVGVELNLVASRIAAAIASEEPELVVPLMEGLKGDLLPADSDAAERLGIRLHGFDAAVEHALGQWERTETLVAR